MSRYRSRRASLFLARQVLGVETLSDEAGDVIASDEFLGYLATARTQVEHGEATAPDRGNGSALGEISSDLRMLAAARILSLMDEHGIAPEEAGQ